MRNGLNRKAKKAFKKQINRTAKKKFIDELSYLLKEREKREKRKRELEEGITQVQLQ
jgi:hypothetical protein